MRVVKLMMSIVGIILAAAGVILMKKDIELSTLPYVLVGIGCGTFGHFFGSMISTHIINSDKDAAIQLEIEKNDERNIAISDKAKSKAFDIMLYVFGALLLALALMEIDFVVIILLVCAYLFVVGMSIYYRMKFNKEM